MTPGGGGALILRGHVACMSAWGMSTVRLFENASHAAAYAAFRPSYPRSVLDVIASFMRAHGHSSARHSLAVDVACGSGQSTFFLCDAFESVVGIDVSPAQIANARAKCVEKPSNGAQIEFRVGSAYELPVGTASADLVSCAQAWHWLDPDKFYAEAKRILRPRGCLAVYGYGNVKLENERGQLLVSEFYRSLREGGYWHKERKHIDEEYQDVLLPFSETERHNIIMTSELSLSQFIGYVSTWSGLQTYCQRHPGSTTLQELQQSLQACLGSPDEAEPRVHLSFPVFLALGLNSS